MYIKIDDNVYNFPEKPTSEDIYEAQIVDGNPTWVVDAQKVQLKANKEAREFLYSTDWKVIRHRDQLALGVPTSLSTVEFENLLEERQIARDKVV